MPIIIPQRRPQVKIPSSARNVPGDLIATDQDALNTWLSTWAEEGERSYAVDLDDLRTIIRRFQEWFTDGIYMIMGNHDLRIDKKTGGQVTLEMLLDDTDMAFSRYCRFRIRDDDLRETRHHYRGFWR